MKTSMKILWCGPFFSDQALLEKRSTNQAAASWSRGLLRGLEAVSGEIRVIGHCTEQRWPRGDVFWQDNDRKWFLDWFPCERIAYCNMWGVRDRWLVWAYSRKVRALCRTWKPDVILCYNSLHPFNVAAMHEARKFGVKCVPIILDGDDPRKDDWSWLLKGNRYADGVVFLSYWAYCNYPDKKIPLLHLDGGADRWKGTQSRRADSLKPFTIVHTGALDYWRGLRVMQELLKVCKRDDVRLAICGKCDKTKRLAELGNDPRVEVKGFLTECEMNSLCAKADAFISVRDPKIGDNILNFPSKIPHYLSWGNPVISTWMESFSPDYREVLYVPDGNNAEGLSRKIDEIMALSPEERMRHVVRQRLWFEERKTWVRQSERLVEWLKSI